MVINKETIMKKLFFLITTMLILVSCDDDQRVIYDTENGQTLVAFNVPSVNLPIVIDDVGSVDVQINVTTASPQDRSFPVEVVTSSTTAPTGSYSVPSTVTIPANQFTGTLRINGIDENVETTPTVLIVKIGEGSEHIASTRTLRVSVFQVCPIPDTFLIGTYLLEQISGISPFGITAFGTQVVQVTSKGPTTRTFNYAYDPGGFESPYFMDLELVCNEFSISGTIQPGNGTLGCGSGSIGQSTGDVASTYDVSDDSIITLNVADFSPDAGCGTGSSQLVVRLTKQ